MNEEPILGSVNLLIALLLSILQMLVKRGKEESCEHYLSPGSSSAWRPLNNFISLLITFYTLIPFSFSFLLLPQLFWVAFRVTWNKNPSICDSNNKQICIELLPCVRCELFVLYALFIAHQNPVILYNPITQMGNNCVPNYLKMKWDKISLRLHLKYLD